MLLNNFRTKVDKVTDKIENLRAHFSSRASIHFQKKASSASICIVIAIIFCVMIENLGSSKTVAYADSARMLRVLFSRI
jgi:hypothetical protein